MKKLGQVLLIGSFGSVFCTSYGKCCCNGDEKNSSKGGRKPANKMDEVKDLFLKCFKLNLLGDYTSEDVIVVKKEGSSVDEIIKNKLSAEEKGKLWCGFFHKVGDVVYMIGLTNDSRKCSGYDSKCSGMLVSCSDDYLERNALNNLDKGFYRKLFSKNGWFFYFLKGKETK